MTAIQLFAIRKDMNIKKIVNLSKKYLVSTIVMGIVVLLIGFKGNNSWTTIIIQGISGMVTYLVMLIILKDEFLLDNINIKMESGKIYGMCGRNGSGKTMLMRAIAGLIKVTGTVDIDGKILGKDEMFPPSIGILIENPSFIANYTGFKNLKILASIQNKISDEEIREAIRKVGLKPDDPRTFKKYSLGMKQRLGIAAAIMEDPDIIILDEPINALDDMGTEQVRDILMKHKERGALIIIACHDADELNFLSDEIIEIAEGRIQNKKE